MQPGSLLNAVSGSRARQSEDCVAQAFESPRDSGLVETTRGKVALSVGAGINKVNDDKANPSVGTSDQVDTSTFKPSRHVAEGHHSREQPAAHAAHVVVSIP